MATTDFNQTALDIITDAFNDLRVGIDGEALTGSQKQYGQRTLNAMVKAWRADEVKLWADAEGEIFLLKEQASYTLGGTDQDFSIRPSKMMNVRRRSTTDIDTPMFEMSREEYKNLPNKTTTGTPVQWFYDRQLTTGVLYVWPVPSTSGETVQFDYEPQLDDFDTNSDTPDFPQEWLEALRLGLAARMVTRYPIETSERLELYARAAEAYDKAAGYDRETSVFMSPDFRWQ